MADQHPRTMLRLSLYYGAAFALIGIHLPFWPVWLAAHGLGPTEIGVVMAVGVGVKLIANPLVAHAADRRGQRRSIMVALALAATAAFALFGWTSGLAAILAVTVLFFAAWSPIMPLAESLKVILKASQNLHAEMLLRTLGREQRGVGSVEAGLEEINGFLKEIAVPAGEAMLTDGSGLSRQTLVTPQAMTALLRYMDQSEYGSLWTGLLPVAGRDGSLAERLKGRATAGRVWAKTGSLAGEAALAGYALNQRNEMVAFVVFANHFNPASSTATETIDRIVDAIARSR